MYVHSKITVDGDVLSRPRGVSWGLWGPRPPGVTKRAPKRRKRKVKEEREKKKRGKERDKERRGTKKIKDRKV